MDNQTTKALWIFVCCMALLAALQFWRTYRAPYSAGESSEWPIPAKRATLATEQRAAASADRADRDSVRAEREKLDQRRRSWSAELADLEETRDWMQGLRGSGARGRGGAVPPHLQVVAQFEKDVRIKNISDRIVSLRVFRLVAASEEDRCPVTRRDIAGGDVIEPIQIPPGVTLDLVCECPWHYEDTLEFELGAPGVPPGWMSDSLLRTRLRAIKPEIDKRRGGIQNAEWRIAQLDEMIAQ